MKLKPRITVSLFVVVRYEPGTRYEYTDLTEYLIETMNQMLDV